MWKFNVIGFGEDIQISEYNEEDNGHYDWHMDVGELSPYRKISISVQLSDPKPYEGGDLLIFNSKNYKKLPNSKGTAILFPSYLLHKVTKVTKGTRKSLVIWITGKPFS